MKIIVENNKIINNNLDLNKINVEKFNNTILNKDDSECRV